MAGSMAIRNFSNENLRKRALSVCDKLGVENDKLRKNLEHGCYSDIFGVVRTLPEDVRKQAVSGFYKGFPNGKKIGEHINRILAIDWFKPKKEYTEKDFDGLSKGIADAFRIEEYPLLVSKTKTVAIDANSSDAWFNALKDVRIVMRDYYSAKDDHVYAALDAGCAAGEPALINDSYFGSQACNDAGMSAKFIILEDALKLNEKYPVNPFEKLMTVYECGLFPAGIKDNSFVIWHPPVS
jgi:hypothetical protein